MGWSELCERHRVCCEGRAFDRRASEGVRVRARIDDASVLVVVARVWDLMVWERSEKLAIF